MKFGNFVLAAAAVLGFSFPAWADSYYFNFNNGTGNGPTSQTIFNHGSITATGYIGNELANLYFKNGGADETGVGLAKLTDHEVAGNGYIQLDLGNVMATYPFGAVSLTAGSLQGSETYSVYGSNIAGVQGTLLGTGNWSSVVFNLGNPLGYRYISLGAPRGNVLLDSVVVSTPEPAAGLLMITGLMAIAAAALFFRRGVMLGLRDGIA